MSDLPARLRSLREDPSDGGFEAALHRRLAEAGAPLPLPFWRRLPEIRLLWPSLAGAAAVAAVLAFVLLRGSQGPSAFTRLPATKVAVVRVNLSAEVEVADAQIRVELPEGLAFWSDGEELNQRHFEWPQALHPGDNEIPIAVRGLKPGRYRMTVSALIGSERVQEEVFLQVVDG
ncbi:MAG TPA: hypothetical protein VH083_14360 [Myxococcales bacterium]|jgi:hypothetical protein|nr:hypothetical protein [Myxococcales bacterium]